ncbi:uncharacterized protein BP5553_03423 [Venustampulla echinocandica]|uniref:Fe2OG dioxygenase domain-containing protein n=1 Tax=Venustampulla echinocandica TaxID=2656787 RepID=A0A370TU72_9HELO|nr:uncharacterized protein BP5553_03423 [Venustampulla echinocandica]RDL39083.1 hypothetical protein BP5553_03423 [Venustampulla echinocandica]
MFQIDEHNLPVVQTRQALLLLDLQNDFVSTDGLLAVDEPRDFLDNILELLPHFRASKNNVIWVRSQVGASRPVNQLSRDSESVITDDQLLPGHRRAGQRVRPMPSQKLLERHSRIAMANGLEPSINNESIEVDDGEEEEEEGGIEETFLTFSPHTKPRVALSYSPGGNFAGQAVKAMDMTQDLIFQKSYYSAFKEGTLLQVMRGKLVTEIFLCGSLTNISVFATAMDAARHGFAITILEDCLGYRSKARHDEALRQLTLSTGCDIISSKELIHDLSLKADLQSKLPRNDQPWVRKGDDLENRMARLKLRRAGQSSSKRPAGASENTRAITADVAASSGGSQSSISLEADEEWTPPVKSAVAEGKKRERVPTKIKTRQRHLKPGLNGIDGAATHGRRSISPTSATLTGAAQALESILPHLEADNVPEPSAELTDPSGAPAKTSEQVPSTEIRTNGGLIEVTGDHDPKVEPPTSSHKESGSPKGLERPSTKLCEGDTTIITGLIDDKLADGIFEKVRDEVRWQKMSHQGGNVPRLVAVQGQVEEDGSTPIYRHPADESPPLLPFSPTVSLIRAKAEQKLGHSVNHVLIQCYRGGTDYISEHSDKTLDIAPNTFIANVSLGAQRTMIFRTKRLPRSNSFFESATVPEPRQSCRAPLPHNSMVKMGLVTNMRWLHAIRQDKRMLSEKSPEELAFDGGRISLTFRLIGTFLDKDEIKIWGQGAVAKTKAEARTVLNGVTPESEKMLKAFGTENQSSEFDWQQTYGGGFDVLHISNSRKLFLSGDGVADLRVKILLAEYGIEWVEGKLSPSFNWKDGNSSENPPPIPEDLPVKFVDNDLSKSTIVGDLAILLYLDTVYAQNPGAKPRSQADLAQQFTRFHQCSTLLEKWRAVPFSIKPFNREMELWEAHATETPFIAGSALSVVDFALWPILHEIHGEWPDLGGHGKLFTYYRNLSKLESIKNVAYPGDGPTETTA